MFLSSNALSIFASQLNGTDKEPMIVCIEL